MIDPKKYFLGIDIQKKTHVKIKNQNQKKSSSQLDSKECTIDFGKIMYEKKTNNNEIKINPISRYIFFLYLPKSTICGFCTWRENSKIENVSVHQITKQ